MSPGGQPPTIDAGCSLSSPTPAGMWSWPYERPIERVSAQPFLTDSGQPTKWLFPSFRHGSAEVMFELPPNGTHHPDPSQIPDRGLPLAALTNPHDERTIQMTTHRALAERFAQTLTDHDLDAFGELLDEQYVNHNRFAAPGKDGSVAVFADFFAAFEDFRAEVDDIVEDGDTLVGRFTYRGRHTWASRQAAPKSSCTRSTSGGSATAGCRSTGTN